MLLPKPQVDRWGWIEWLEIVWFLVVVTVVILSFVHAANIEPAFVLERR